MIIAPAILALPAILLCVPISPASAAAQQESAPRTLQVEDFARIREVREPRISPEGEQVAYTVTSTSLDDDEQERRVWVASLDGGEPLPMTAAGSSAWSPRWSPDGRYLSFLSDREDDTAQVWILDRRGGEARQLTDVSEGVRGYEWAPDGDRLVLVVRDPAEDTWAFPPADDDVPAPRVVDRLQFKRDYVGYLGHRRTHLYVFDLETEESRQITFGDFDDSDPAWSPDGSRIAFVSNRSDNPDRNYDTDIWVVEPGTASRERPPLQVTTNPGPDRAPAWSPDGTRIAHVSAVDLEAMVYATPHLAVVPAGGGEATVLTAELDRHVSAPRFSGDGQRIYFILEDSAERHLGVIPAGGGEVARPIAGPRSVGRYSGHYDVGPDGAVVALVGEPQRPGELFVTSGSGLGELRRLTRVNDGLFEELRLGEVRKVHFPSADGTEIEGFIVTPPDYEEGRRYPTLLRIHGGPVSQYEHTFNFEAQLFAAHGYVVVMTNPRGSSGYGQEFSRAIWQDWGGIDYEDVMAGVDYAIEAGYADPDRLGVGGWSYGGILTNNVIVRTDRFEGAVSGASAALYIANYGHDQYQRWYEMELGLPWENREIWERISPFNYVENAVTPTLFVGGAVDWNVPIINSEIMYQAMKRLGRTTRLVVYPDQHHGIDRPSYRADLYQRYLDWYGEHVKRE